MAGKTKNYEESIEVSAPADICFGAVAENMDKWWTQTTDGKLSQAGDRVTVVFPPDFGHWTFEATVFDRPGRMEMQCVDAHHKVDGLPQEIDQEWLGTTIIWEFAPAGNKTVITMTHDGLTPALNCWDICLDGWNHFFKTSLKSYLDGHEPSPHTSI